MGARAPIRCYVVRVSFWGRVEARSATEAKAVAVHTMCTASIKDLPFARPGHVSPGLARQGLGFWWDNQTIHAQPEGQMQ